MIKIYCSIVLSVCVICAKAQIITKATTASAIGSQIPGYSQVTSFNTKTIAYTPSSVPTPPTPIDDDSTTEDQKIYRYADNVSTNITMADGNITSTTIGKVWTLRVSVPNALNIGLIFNQFNLSTTAEMYIFNEARTVLDSSIKKSHFTTSTTIGIMPMKGNSLIIYIVEPNNFSTFQSSIAIQNVEAGFQEIYDVGDVSSPLARPSINCDPSIQCRQDKVNFARGVARFASNGYQGSGTLINNEVSNGRAYFLTAFHVVDANNNNVIDASEIAALVNARFQFQFWRTGCSSTINNTGLQFSGATLRASSRQTDVVLLELNNPPGVGDLVNYIGWNRQTSAPPDNTGFIIHHPQGEDMRITSAGKIKSWFWNGNYWTAHYTSGTVAPGSSGSALMNDVGQIIGQLRSGWSSCNYTDFGDRYGKFDRSWSGAGLQNWLSPTQNLQATPILNLTDIPINGPSTVGCTVPGIFNTLPNLLGITYEWTVTAGIQINNGQGTSSVTISRIANSNITSGTLTLTLRSPTKGRTRIYTVSKQMTFGTPPISISSSTSGCNGVYQQWNLVNNTPNNGSNWNWSVNYLSTNSEIIIYNPNSPSTMLSVKGGGAVRLTYTNLCGVVTTDGVTVYSTCSGFKMIVSPNPARNQINLSLNPEDNNKSISNASSSSTPLKTVESKGKTIVSLFEVNTQGLVKQWKYNETQSLNYNLNISGFKKGIYVLQVDRDNQTNIAKIIIE